MTAGTEGLAAWPPAAVATVVAAVGAASVALVGALVGGVWAVLRWRRDVAREERDRAWSRFVWTVDHAADHDTGKAEIGRLAAGTMYNMRILGDEDELIGRLVLELVTGREQEWRRSRNRTR